MKGGANGVDILRLYAGRESRLVRSSSLLVECTPLCPSELPLAIFTECFAPLRTSRLRLAVVIVHSPPACSMASRQRSWTPSLYYLEIDPQRMTARALQST